MISAPSVRRAGDFFPGGGASAKDHRRFGMLKRFVANKDSRDSYRHTDIQTYIHTPYVNYSTYSHTTTAHAMMCRQGASA